MILSVSVNHLRQGDKVIYNDGTGVFGTVGTVGAGWFRYEDTDFNIPFCGQIFLVDRWTSVDLVRTLVEIVKS